MPRVSVVRVSLFTSHYSFVSSSSWLLGKSLLPLGHKANAQLSRLNWRHTERWGLTPSCSVPWRTTSDTSNTLLRDQYCPKEILIFPNFNISDSMAYSLGWVGCLWSLSLSWFSQPCCELFTQGRLMASVARLFLLLEQSRSVWTQKASVLFSILLRLDSECTSPRSGLLCQDLSLEKSFRGFVDFQKPRGWANPWPTTWLSSAEYYTIWYALFFYHGVDTEMRSLTMRHSLLTLFWLGDGSTWGTWWWCTWSHVERARLTYSPMAASLPECSRMSALTWAERQILRSLTLMTRMMINWWRWWNLRRPPMVLG